jgi:alpha-glucoside transport system permease protein
MTAAHKLGTAALSLVIFVGLVALVLLIAGRMRGRREDRAVAALFLAPMMLGLAVVVVYPAVNTILNSLHGPDGGRFVGLHNFVTVFTSADELTVLRNTALWVVVSPLLATGIGLLYAALVERSRFESAAKALIFLPMAISFVGASIIWKFVYEYRPDQQGVHQIGLLNQIVVWLGGAPQQWLIDSPWNTFFLIAVIVWTQAGFAMTVLSAAIKGISSDVIEAARLDGVSRAQLLRHITIPSVTPTIIVVLTTIAIWTMKVFDIVRTMTGGQFNTNVIANEFYTQSFRADDQGLGSALAVLLFILVVPAVVFNIRHMRRDQGR